MISNSRFLRVTVALVRRLGGGAASMPAVRVLIGIAVLAAAFTTLMIVEAALSPWARSLTFGPTLTGEWTGEMTTPSGAKHLVWIDIEHARPASACPECPGIEGAAATCDESGKTQTYEIWGDVDNWSGAFFHLKAREKEESAVHLLYLEGEWRGDEVSVRTTLVAPGVPPTTRSERNAQGETTIIVVEGHPDTRRPISFTLGRSTRRDFDERCKAKGS